MGWDWGNGCGRPQDMARRKRCFPGFFGRGEEGGLCADEETGGGGRIPHNRSYCEPVRRTHINAQCRTPATPWSARLSSMGGR